MSDTLEAGSAELWGDSKEAEADEQRTDRVGEPSTRSRRGDLATIAKTAPMWGLDAALAICSDLKAHTWDSAARRR